MIRAKRLETSRHRNSETIGPLALYVALAVAALLLGRATVYGVLFPFVPATATALLAVEPLGAGIVALVGLTSLRQAWGGTPFGPALATLLLVAVGPALFGERARRGPGGLIWLFLASLLAGSGFAVKGGVGPEGYWLALFQAIFTAGLAAAYAPALRHWTGTAARSREPAEPALPGGLAGTAAPAVGTATTAAGSAAVRMGAVALLASAVAGLDGLSPGGAFPVAFLGAALVTLAALSRGGGVAAAVGALFAAVASLSRGIDVALVGTLALAGTMTALLNGLGRVGPIFGVTLGFLAGTFGGAATSELLAQTLLSALAGAVLAALVPAGWRGAALASLGLDALDDPQAAIPARGLASGVVAPWQEQASQRLKAVARLFDELARAFSEVAPSTSAAAPAGAGGAANAAAVSSGTAGANPSVANPAGVELAQLVEAVAGRVCQGCDLQSTCWQSEYYRTYRNLSDVWTLAEQQGTVTAGRLPEDFRRQCIHPVDMAAAVSQLAELVRLSRYWEQRVDEGRGLVSNQLKGVAQIMDGLADSVLHASRAGSGLAEASASGGATGRAADYEPPLSFTVGVSRVSKGGAAVSGDALLHRRLGSDKLLLALSDGMGAGPRAAHESRVTVDLVERLIQAGFAPEVAVRTVNSVLLLRSADEVFATLDLLLLNLETGHADFLKTGAAPSFIRRGGQVTVVKSASLPAGILSQIEVPLSQYELRAGDLLVMVTDGLLTDLGEEQVAEFLERFPRQEPHLVAEALLNRAMGGKGGRPTDDVTVCAVLLAGTVGAKPRQTGGWRAVNWRASSG